MISRFNRWLLIAIIVIGVPFWWLLMDNAHSSAPPKPVHIAYLRALAAIIPGNRPIAVIATRAGSRWVVGETLAAGIGLQRRRLAMITWALPVPGKGPIVIDPGPDPDEAGVDSYENIDGAKVRRIAAETRIASLILHTHGPLTLQEPAKSAALARTQPPSFATAQAASFATAQAIAPGVVIIPTPGHAPDTRLIYVQLANGREFLFAGNIATLSENWTALRLRSHLAAFWGPLQNDDETYAWLRTLHQLGAEAPRMAIVPGHDDLWLTQHVAIGIIAEWKERPAPRAQRGKPR